jgi:hypothetical protein
MPNRVVREGLLDSGRYWSATIEARQLFMHLMLLADDFGCVSLAPAFVRRRCFDDGPAQEKIDRLITQLMDADLIRVYDHEGARYGFIPRFGQRLKRMTLKHPEPPAAILEGDEEAQEKFQEIRDKTKNPAAEGRHQPPAARPEVESESERTTTAARAPAKKRNAEPSAVFLQAWAEYPKRAGDNPRGRAWKAWRARLAEGHTETEMLDGIRRYAGFVRASGREGSEFIKQAATLLGPDKGFLEPWRAEQKLRVAL